MPTVYCDGVSATQEDDHFSLFTEELNVFEEATNRKEEMVICGPHRWSNTVNTVITPANRSYKMLLCEHPIPQAVGHFVFGL